MSTPIDTVMADRRKRWQQMPPERRMQHIHTAIVGTLDHARWLRKEQQRRTRARLAAQAVKVREYNPL